MLVIESRSEQSGKSDWDEGQHAECLGRKEPLLCGSWQEGGMALGSVAWTQTSSAVLVHVTSS